MVPDLIKARRVVASQALADPRGAAFAEVSAADIRLPRGASVARLCRYREPGDLRVMRVSSTLDIDVFCASRPLWDAISGRPDVVPVATEFALAFDAAGELASF
jgi:hypothetical protein